VSPAELLSYLAAAAATGILAWAAISDILTRRIPNVAVGALLAVGVIWLGLSKVTGPISALEAMGIGLVVTVGLYAFKIIGAGDSKLFIAAALFGGLGYLPALAVATTLSGGAIAAVSLASRPQRALVMFTLRGRGDYGRGVPYGCAIAIGGAVVIWGSITGLLPAFGQEPRATAESIAHGLLTVSAPQPMRPSR
jgi:prepilin peptidase CpaA